jgi:glutaminyl-tRNA synthetase
MIPFGREIYIERDDFMEDPPRKFFRMGPGREVRLKGAYIVKCEDYKKDENGNIIEIYCTYDPETKSGSGVNRKVKGTLHWVSAEHAIDATVRVYDRLFSDEDPAGHKDKDFKEFLNPDSLQELTNCKLEPWLIDAKPGDKYQFQRIGYFCVDPDTTENNLVFNRTVPLRDSWAKRNK